jgi:DNA polymerase-3 subunit epsilon
MLNYKLRHLRLEKPLAVIDVESTGLDPHVDRIVELAIVKLTVDGEPTWLHSLINPERNIPDSAQAVHGISDAAVAYQPTFRQIAREVHGFLKRADLAGFHLAFDLAMLSTEFARAHHAFRLTGRALLDAQTIFRRKEPRDLRAAVRQYLGREHTNAHSARADARAALEVLDAQLGRYADLPRSPAALHAELVDVDLAGWFRRDEQGRILFAVGDHAGQSLETVALEAPASLQALVEGGTLLEDSRTLLRQALAGRPLPPDDRNRSAG